ncbi:hypothetical protein VULLAG_LOCUS19770 [Vulpes lagopus]
MRTPASLRMRCKLYFLKCSWPGVVTGEWGLTQPDPRIGSQQDTSAPFSFIPLVSRQCLPLAKLSWKPEGKEVPWGALDPEHRLLGSAAGPGKGPLAWGKELRRQDLPEPNISQSSCLVSSFTLFSFSLNSTRCYNPLAACWESFLSSLGEGSSTKRWHE